MHRPGISFSALLAVAAVACTADVPASEDIVGAEEQLSAAGDSLAFHCTRGGDTAKVVIAKNDGAFDVTATVAEGVLFAASGKRASLNARPADAPSRVVNEHFDFSDKGLVAVPVDAPTTLEIDAAAGTKRLVFKDPTTSVELACRVSATRLGSFLGIDLVSSAELEDRLAGVNAVGFDIDDTLAFTTPAFVRGLVTGGAPTPTDTLFWTHTNGCDQGCSEETIALPDGSSRLLPANAKSTAKAKAIELIAFHKSRGHRVYAITARPDINGDPLRDYIVGELGIARDDIFFEPDVDQPGNPSGKTDRIEALGLDVFYGDSDSDITDAKAASAKPVRFLRSPRSSNRKAGKLNKYHPGYYGEPILADSYD